MVPVSSNRVGVPVTVTTSENGTRMLMVLPTLVLEQTPVFAQAIFFGAVLSAIMSCSSATLLAPSVAFAETLASVGANCIVGPEHAAVGQEINANHLRPAFEGETVTGTTRLLYLGARSQVWSIEIHNAAEQLVCVSRITMALIKKR